MAKIYLYTKGKGWELFDSIDKEKLKGKIISKIWITEGTEVDCDKLNNIMSNINSKHK